MSEMKVLTSNGSKGNFSIRDKTGPGNYSTYHLCCCVCRSLQLPDPGLRNRTNRKERQLNAAVLTAARLETEITKTVSALETAANNSAFASDDTDVLVQTLLAIKEQNQIFSTVFMTDSTLIRLNEKGELSSWPAENICRKSRKQRKQ